MSKRILIADDDKAVGEFLSDALDGLGYELETALDGREALTKAKAGSFDLVLLDVMMPLVDGYRVASELASSMGGRAPKILFLTARDTKREGHISAMVGAAGMIQKPFQIPELRRKIAELLG